MRFIKKIQHFNIAGLALGLLVMLVACGQQSTMRSDVIVENENYTVTADSVVEGQWWHNIRLYPQRYQGATCAQQSRQ